MPDASAPVLFSSGTLDASPSPISGVAQTGFENQDTETTANGALTLSGNVGDPITGGKFADGVELFEYGTLQAPASRGTPTNHTGVLVPSYITLFYDRVHLIPSGTLDLGVIAGNVTTDVLVWNAFTSSSVDITALSLTGSGNTTTQGAPALPLTLAPLATTEFDLLTTGASDTFAFSTTLQVVESTAQNPSLVISGFASLILGLKPERPMNLSLEWRTDTMTSNNGKEQRQSLRSLPRQTYTVRYQPLENRDKNKLRIQIQSHHNKAFGLPLWMEEKILNADASATDTTIFIDTAYAQFAVGDPVIVWRDERNFAIGQIATIAADRITLVREIGTAFSAGATVAPVGVGQILGDTSGQIRSPQFEGVQFSLTLNKAVSMPSYVASTTYKGDPVILDRSFANSNPRTGQNIDSRTIDFGLGTFERDPQWIHAKDWREHRFVLRTQQELYEFRTFLYWLRGRYRAVWIPTFQDDFELTENVLSADTNLDVTNVDYSTLIYQNLSKWRNISLRKPDGTYFLREIIGAQELSSEVERLQIDSALGTAYNSDELQVSILRRCRLLADRVEFQHVREDFTQVTLPFVALDE